MYGSTVHEERTGVAPGGREEARGEGLCPLRWGGGPLTRRCSPSVLPPQTDHAKTPLLRMLFAAACAPYVRRVRAWVYDPQERGDGDGGSGGGAASPPAAPGFAAPLQRQLTAAGLQMRLLEGLAEELGDIAARFRRMAAAEVRAPGWW